MTAPFPRTLLLLVLLLACQDAMTHPRTDIVALRMTVTLDSISPQADHGHRKVGDVDELHVVFDAAAIDKRTKRVKLLNLQHWTQGEYQPATPDSVAMPVSDAWLDMASEPYRLHYRAAVTHGTPIVIEVDEDSRRLTIRPQGRPLEVEIGGPYVIESKLLRSAAITHAGTPSSESAKHNAASSHAVD